MKILILIKIMDLYLLIHGMITKMVIIWNQIKNLDLH